MYHRRHQDLVADATVLRSLSRELPLSAGGCDGGRGGDGGRSDVDAGSELIPPGVSADVGCDGLGNANCVDLAADAVGDSSARIILGVNRDVPVVGREFVGVGIYVCRT